MVNDVEAPYVEQMRKVGVVFGYTKKHHIARFAFGCTIPEKALPLIRRLEGQGLISVFKGADWD